MSDNLPEKYIETVSGEIMGGTVEIVRELSGFAGNACLIRQNGKYYIVSSANAYGGYETLIFHADSNGVVKEWIEVGGGRGIDRAQAIAEFEQHGPYSLGVDDDDDNSEDDFPWKRIENFTPPSENPDLPF